MSFINSKLGTSILLASTLLPLGAPIASAEDGKQYSGVECTLVSTLPSQLRINGKFRSLVSGTVSCPVVREKVAETRINYAEVTVKGVGRTECSLLRTSPTAGTSITHVAESTVLVGNGMQRHRWFVGGASVAAAAGESFAIECTLDPDDEIVNYRVDEDA